MKSALNSVKLGKILHILSGRVVSRLPPRRGRSVPKNNSSKLFKFPILSGSVVRLFPFKYKILSLERLVTCSDISVMLLPWIPNNFKLVNSQIDSGILSISLWPNHNLSKLLRSPKLDGNWSIGWSSRYKKI